MTDLNYLFSESEPCKSTSLRNGWEDPLHFLLLVFIRAVEFFAKENLNLALWLRQRFLTSSVEQKILFAFSGFK